MIEVSSRDFDLTPAIRDEVMNMEDSFEKHLDDGTRIQVTLSKDAPDVFRVHMQAHYRGEDIISDHVSHNFHKALELCREHFVKQVDKRRQKLQNRA